jgi:hypothetical protein
MAEPKPLNYEPAEKSRRKRSYRRAPIIVVVTAIIVSAIVWGPPGWQWCQLIFWQWRCLAYSKPADHVVYEFTKSNGTTAFRREDDVSAERNFRNIGSRTQIYSVSYVPIFLHERQRPDGVKRLVSLDFSPWYGVMPQGLLLDMWEPTWSSTPKLVRNTTIVATVGSRPFNNIKIYAGQPDPTDPTHFTFVYDMDGKRYTVDGWVNNSDQVVLSERP